ncbi:hypothetical protein ACHAQA_000649 [Verticillium albo-atrum]
MSVPVFHHVPKPISIVEFYEAIQATCPPRFPHARQAIPRTVALAVSGGADSMALAFLFSRMRLINHHIKVADNSIIAKPTAYIVDHRLRPTSTKEALKTFNVVRDLGKGIKAEVLSIQWQHELNMRADPGAPFDPNTLPNVETLARRLRYRKLGRICAQNNIASLFTAHHEDDQYETVLMRLLNGHRARGLRGMAPAANIPECFDIHGAHESGFVDDQLRSQPFISLHPRRRDWPILRRDMRNDLDQAAHWAELRRGLETELNIAYIDQQYAIGTDGKSQRSNKRLPPIPPIQCEDAGVVVYRPLLGFPKDRLVATCEANDVPWIEDASNKDPTMTMRNAVRYMWRGHNLPAALSKPAILAMSRRCAARAEAEEAEADRWATGMIIRNFQPNVGTVTIRFPDLGVRPPRRRRPQYSQRRHDLRVAHRRTIAALLIRRAIAFATPDPNPPAISTLQNCLPRLFPSLASDVEVQRMDAVPKAFNHASVLFLPMPSASSSSPGQEWLLTREPHPSSQPLPVVSFVKNDYLETPFHFLDKPEIPPPESAPWHSWRRWTLWDGRFWIRVRPRFKGVIRIGPCLPAYATEFRNSLPPAERTRLTDLLRRHAPGKVRYTLPAIYAVNSPPLLGINEDKDNPPMPTPRQPSIGWWRGYQREIKMLGLLTVPIHLPGVEQWLQWEARYKKVDTELLGRHLFTASRRGRRRKRWMRRGRGGCTITRERELAGPPRMP